LTFSRLCRIVGAIAFTTLKSGGTMAELKTKPNNADVDAFLKGVADERKRADCFAVLALMRRVTGAEPRMWGDSIVGFDSYHYVYATGNSGDWPLTGFAPRAQNITLYIMAGFDHYDDLLARLGKYKIGKSCLYVKRLADVDQAVLEQLVAASVEHMRRTNPPANG
jgi:hypothetical protein